MSNGQGPGGEQDFRRTLAVLDSRRLLSLVGKEKDTSKNDDGSDVGDEDAEHSADTGLVPRRVGGLEEQRSDNVADRGAGVEQGHAEERRAPEISN